MKKERIIDVTHSMKFTNIEFYKCNLFLKNKIIRQYESIEIIERSLWNDGTIRLRILGTRTVYGYKIEGRGFYDVENDVFYNQSYLDSLSNYEINEIKGTSVRKLIRK